MNTIKNKISLLLKKIKLKKVNFLNHKFKKYIVKFEEKNDTLKVYNSNGDVRVINNTIPNKIKIIDIIKEHKIEINKKINYYENNKEDYKIIILSSGLMTLILGCFFILSFFVGSYILLILSLLSFGSVLSFFVTNLYKILLFREEVKRLKFIMDNNEILLDDNEIVEFITDILTLVKDKVYTLLLKVFNVFDRCKVN